MATHIKQDHKYTIHTVRINVNAPDVTVVSLSNLQGNAILIRVMFYTDGGSLCVQFPLHSGQYDQVDRQKIAS